MAVTLSIAQTATNSIIIGTIDSVDSQILKEKRKIWVHVPVSIAANKKFKVIYLLDGDNHFHSMVGLVKSCLACSEMIIVGIPNTNRGRDFSPPKITPTIDSFYLRTKGGDENFIRFIEKELIPHINNRYPASSYRMIIGHSLGGLFVINTLLKHTPLFNSYIAIDPSLSWDNPRLLGQYEAILKQKKFDNRTLFIGIANTLKAGMDTLQARKDTTGTLLHYQYIMKFSDILKTMGNNGLLYSYKYYPDENHNSVPLMSEYDGLRFIFQKREVKLTSQQLKVFEGRYTLPPEKNVFIQITAKEDHLLLKELWSGKEVPFVPESELEFFSKNRIFPLEFTKDAAGFVTHMLAFKSDLWERIRE